MSHPPSTLQSLARTADIVAVRGPVEATFVAESSDEAVRLAKRALGADAMIVGTRRIVRDGGSARFEIRAAIGDVDSGGRAESAPVPAAPARPATLLERLLRDNDVPAEDARDLSLAERSPSRSLAEVRASLVRILRARVGWGDPTASSRIVALIGPTGVGKTTTLAKLAARDALVHQRRVALVSCDDYRLGGADQLAGFAQLMDVPFALATDVASFASALARFGFADRIYVDTAGRSPRATDTQSPLAVTLAHAGAMPVLCVAAHTRSHELLALLAQHAHFEPRAIVATKLDEAELVGAPLVAAVRTGLPLSHFATGQRVPEDIEGASAERLASLLLGERVLS